MKWHWFITDYEACRYCFNVDLANVFKKVIGKPDNYGNILLEFEREEDLVDDITISCNSETDYNEAYNRVCDYILHRNGAIDLRNLKVEIVLTK